MFGRKKDLSFFTLKHSPGKSKRENRENNEHLVPRTFAPNTQNLEIYVPKNIYLPKKINDFYKKNDFRAVQKDADLVDLEKC